MDTEGNAIESISLQVELRIISMKLEHCYNKEICFLFVFTTLILGIILFMQIVASIVKF